MGLKENKYRLLLFLTTLFGLIFRIMNANNRRSFGDPPHFTLGAKNFLDSGLLVTWDQSTFLWHAMTDIFYKIFGVTQFASRFSSVLFGTLTILAIYLFVYEFSKNKRIAIVSSMLYAFVPTFILNSSDELDISVLFFIVLIFYFLIKGLKRNSNKDIIISGVIFGLACMWKAYVPVLIVPWLGFILYYSKLKKYNIKKNYKVILYVFLIILLLVSPVLVYNYLNYKHNQVPTFFFVKFFKGLDNENVKNVYGWVSSGELYKNNTFFQRMFINADYGDPTQNTPSGISVGISHSLYSNGHFITIGALIGIFFMFFNRKKSIFAKEYFVFFLLYFIIPWFVLVDGNWMNKHFIHFIAFSLPIVAFMIDRIYLYLKRKIPLLERLHGKGVMLFLFGILIFLEIFVVLSLPFPGGGNELFFSTNPEGQLMKFKKTSIPENSFIIYDERIYNSMASWLFNDRLYISVPRLNQFIELNEQSNSKQVVPVFIVECVPDQCGWPINPSLNDSMEGFFGSINNQSIPVVHKSKVKMLHYPNYYYYNPLISREELPDYFKVYKTQMGIDINLAKQWNLQYSYFLYPPGYENKDQPMFKNFIYAPQGVFEIMLDKLAWMMFYLEILLCFFIVGWIIYEVYIYV